MQLKRFYRDHNAAKNQSQSTLHLISNLQKQKQHINIKVKDELEENKINDKETAA